MLNNLINYKKFILILIVLGVIFIIGCNHEPSSGRTCDQPGEKKCSSWDILFECQSILNERDVELFQWVEIGSCTKDKNEEINDIDLFQRELSEKSAEWIIELTESEIKCCCVDALFTTYSKTGLASKTLCTDLGGTCTSPNDERCKPQPTDTSSCNLNVEETDLDGFIGATPSVKTTVKNDYEDETSKITREYTYSARGSTGGCAKQVFQLASDSVPKMVRMLVNNLKHNKALCNQNFDVKSYFENQCIKLDLPKCHVAANSCREQAQGAILEVLDAQRELQPLCNQLILGGSMPTLPSITVPTPTLPSTTPAPASVCENVGCPSGYTINRAATIPDGCCVPSPTPACQQAFSNAQFKFWEGGPYLDKPTKADTHLVVFYQGPSSGFDHNNVRFVVDGRTFTPEGSISTATSGNIVLSQNPANIQVVSEQGICTSASISW